MNNAVSLGMVFLYSPIIYGVTVLNSDGSNRGPAGMGSDGIVAMGKACQQMEDLITCVVTMWIICILASLYPAVKAARLQVVEAITHV